MSPAAPGAELDASGRTSTAGPTLALLGLFLAALSLRPQLAGLAPLLDRIRDDLGVSYSWVGSLTTIPLVCMGVFAPLTPALTRRFGLERTVTAALAGLAVAGGLRAVSGARAGLLATTILLGVAIAVAGTALPMVVRNHFLDRPAVATGMVVAGIQLGAAGSTLTAVPLADALSSAPVTAVAGWRAALLVFAAVAVVSTACWIGLTRGRPRGAGVPVPGVPVATPLLRRPVVWVAAAAFALQSMVFYALVTWLPAHLVTTGWPEARAGAALTSLNLAGLATSLTVPRLADRRGSRRAYLLFGTGLTALAVVGLLAQPAAGWSWALLAGVGLSLLFVFTLTLPVDITRDPQSTGTVSSIVLGVGFGAAAAAPLTLGAIRDATGSFAAALVALLAVLAVLAATAGWLSPSRLTPEETRTTRR